MTQIVVAGAGIAGLATAWRADLDLPGRVALAGALWQTDIHEARIAAAKLLTQARITPDQPTWDLIVSWVPSPTIDLAGGYEHYLATRTAAGSGATPPASRISTRLAGSAT